MATTDDLVISLRADVSQLQNSLRQVNQQLNNTQQNGVIDLTADVTQLQNSLRQVNQQLNNTQKTV